MATLENNRLQLMSLMKRNELKPLLNRWWFHKLHRKIQDARRADYKFKTVDDVDFLFREGRITTINTSAPGISVKFYIGGTSHVWAKYHGWDTLMLTTLYLADTHEIYRQINRSGTISYHFIKPIRIGMAPSNYWGDPVSVVDIFLYYNRWKKQKKKKWFNYLFPYL